MADAAAVSPTGVAVIPVALSKYIAPLGLIFTALSQVFPSNTIASHVFLALSGAIGATGWLSAGWRK